jgi:hypothetical protein
MANCKFGYLSKSTAANSSADKAKKV